MTVKLNYQLFRMDVSLIFDTVLLGVQLLLSYFLMCIFNVWLCTAVILGEAAVNLLFRTMLPDMDSLNDSLIPSGSCCDEI